MEKTRVIYHRDYTIGKVDERVFGGFLEHIGRAVYEGVYEPGSPLADENGFRTDVLDAMRPLGFTAMRYPGGNFVSGYHWEDGVGPKSARPVVRDLAWQSVEPNQFGTDEFLKMSKMMGWTPMMAVNLGTGTPEEARNWVEYCNAPAGTRYSSLRAANGSPEPYDVRLWCLGNEMDGPWQLGHVPADHYAIRAQQAAKLMKDTDPSVETVACGSCGIKMATYMEWDRSVLEYIGPYADYVSLHSYVGNPSMGNYFRGKPLSDTANFLAVTNDIDRQIEDMDAVCRVVQARTGAKKRHFLAFDEWNVWYRAVGPEHWNGRGKYAPHLNEEVYNLEDALVVAGYLNSFIRHADVVKIANLAQIVNVLAPIFAYQDRVLLQSIYHPFAMFSQRRDGVSLRPVVKGPGYESPSYGYVDSIDTSAILGETADGGVLHAFLVNRGVTETAEVEINFGGGVIKSAASAELLTGPHAKAENTLADPCVVTSRPFNNIRIHEGRATVQLPPLSVAAISFSVE
jgi:alpha-N-arabinofuranosidase